MGSAGPRDTSGPEAVSGIECSQWVGGKAGAADPRNSRRTRVRGLEVCCVRAADLPGSTPVPRARELPVVSVAETAAGLSRISASL